MPSPVGHALASVAAGWVASPPPAASRAFRVQVLLLGAVGLAPDVDLLVGRHSAETHSLGAAVLVASLAVWWRWPAGVSGPRIWAAVFLAWIVHPLLDAMAPDTTAPHGVMLLWPVSREYVQFELTPFMAISRRYWLPGFVSYTVTAVAREVVLLAPVAAMAWWWRRQTPVDHPRPPGR